MTEADQNPSLLKAKEMPFLHLLSPNIQPVSLEKVTSLRPLSPEPRAGRQVLTMWVGEQTADNLGGET